MQFFESKLNAKALRGNFFFSRFSCVPFDRVLKILCEGYGSKSGLVFLVKDSAFGEFLLIAIISMCSMEKKRKG